MGTTLTGKRVQNTYDSLLKLSDNDNLTGTAKIVGDGLGNDSPIYLSTSKIGIGVSPTYQFQTSGDGKFGGSLIIAGNLTVNGTTTIVDSTIVAIGDNMIEMAKDNTANTMDIGWYGTIVESGTKYVGTYYDAGSGVTTPTFYIGLGTTEPSSTAAWTTKGKLVIGQLDATGATINGNLSVTGTIADSDGDVGTSGQLLSSTGSGTNWIDLEADTAKRLEVDVKNVFGATMTKGTVVHAQPTGTLSGNVIEVVKADANVAANMPAIGVLNEDLANNAEGKAVMFGTVQGFDTSSFSVGDELYVSTTAGEFTATKPTATTELIQKIAVVIKSHASNGLIKVFGAGRSNDVPNEVDRDLSIAGNLKVDDYIEIEADSGYGRLEIGGPSGGYIDLKTPFSDDYDLRIITDTTESQFTGSGNLKLNAGNTLTLTLDGSTQNATFAADIFSDGLYVNATSAVAGTQVAIVKDGEQNLQRWGTSADGGTQDSYRFRIDQSLKFIGNSGSGDTITIHSSSGNIDTSGQITAYQSTIYRDSGGYALRLDSGDSSTDNDLRFAKGGTDYAAIQNNSNSTHNFEFYVNDGTNWLLSNYIERANGNVNFNYAINSIGNSGGMYFYNTGSGHGVIETMSGKDLNILSGSGDIYVKDNLQLNASNTSPSIIFANDAKTRKIVLYDVADNDYQFYGFGLEGSTLVYSTYTTSDDHVFFAGTSSTTRDELARIKGGGGVQFSQYGSGSFTGTSAYNLAVDSSGNIIETDGDVIDGSGTANYVAKWIDSNTLGNTIIYEDGSKVGINVTPTGILDVKAANAYSRFFSYSASAYTFVSIGRTASELEIGVAAAANQFFTGASAGDGVIKVPSGKLHLGYSSGSPAITIDNNNVGIGSTSWSGGYKLYVTGGPTFVSNYLSLGNNSYIRADVANELRFQSGATATTFYNAGNSSELMRISNTGYFSVGTQSSSGRVTIEDSGDVEYLTLNTTATTNKRVRLQFTQNDNAGIEIGIDYSVNNSKNMYFYDRDYGGQAWLFMSQTNNWFQGSLGVGMTSNPSARLDVRSSGTWGTYGRSNSGDINAQNTNTATTEGGWISISGYMGNTTASYPMGAITAKKSTTAADGNYGGDLSFWTTAGSGQTGEANSGMYQRMTINRFGRVGIGETNPPSKLYVKDTPLATSGAILTLRNSQATASNTTFGGVFFNSAPGYDFSIGKSNVNAASTLSFRNGNTGTSLMDINPSGYVGITNNNPLTNLHVTSTSTAKIRVNTTGVADSSVEIWGYDAGVHLGDNTNANRWAIWNDGPSTSSSLKFGSYALGTWYADGSQAMTLTSSGNVGINDTSPLATLSLISRDSTRPTQTIANAAGGGSGYVFQRWQYVSSTTAYLCDLTQKVTSGVVRYAFDVTNNSSSYPNNLVLDRGQVGIGVETPSATLHINAATPSLTLETSANSNDPVITLKSSGAITGEGAQIYYDNSVGTLHLTTTYVDSTADIVFHTATGADQATGNVRMRVKGNGDITFADTLSTKSNRINSGYSTAANDSDIWINYEGYLNGNSYYRDFRVGNGRNGQIMMCDGSSSRVGVMGASKYPDAKFEVYHDGGNGGGNYTDYGILTEASGSYQATIGAHNTGDGYANLNLSSDVSGQKLWHLSKRTSSLSHRFEWFYYDAGFTSRFCFFTNGDFHADGDIVAYSTTISDASLKDNVVTIDNALDKVKQLRGVSYKWNSGPRNQQKDLGVIAQEVEKVFPEIVYEKQALYHGSKQVKSVDYEKLTAVLIESVKELSAKVEALENKCNCNCK